MALAIRRRVGQSFTIGNAMVTIKSIQNKQVDIVIAAPPEVKILRSELEKKQQAKEAGKCNSRKIIVSIEMEKNRSLFTSLKRPSHVVSSD